MRRWRFIAGAGVLMALLAAPAAVGAKAVKGGGKAKAPKESLIATTHYWQVEVNGRNKRVADGGTVSYCASADIGGLRPIIVLKARSDAHINHIYYTRLYGPKAAGPSPVAEFGFHGRSTTTRILYPATLFKGLVEATNTPAFVGGTYQAEVGAVVGKKELGPKAAKGRPRREVALRESVRLVPRKGC